MKHTARLEVGFDTEFVRAGAAEVQDDDAAVKISDAVLRGSEVLCYSVAMRNIDTGVEQDGVIGLKSGQGGRRHRLTLAGFLATAIDEAVEANVLDQAACRTRAPGEKRGPTLRIDLTAHFTRADLCGFKDWKSLRKKFDSVRGTFATTTTPIVQTVWRSNGHPTVCTIYLFDTLLLAPAGFQGLEKLGTLLDLPKLNLPPGYSKDRMDVFRAEQPGAFTDYAVRDAVIALRWLGMIKDFLSGEFGLPADRIPPTLASAGVKVFKAMAENGINLADFLGGETKKEMFTPHPAIQDHLSLVANAYHGGRNEAYWVGPTPVEDIYDIDIKGAYTSAMAGIRMPDWDAAETTTNLARLAVIDSAIALARVQFRFPLATRYPSLPVRAGEGRGLVYPLSGETHVTGPELVVALAQGAEIRVLSGLVVPFIDGDKRRPFADFSRRIAEVRAKFRDAHPGKEKASKEIGNALYGKTAQAVDGYRTSGTGAGATGKRVFDSRTGRTENLPPSSITSPALAAWITGMVRAVCSELAASIPAHRTIYTLTTDGFLTNAPIEEVGTAGPVTQAFAGMREVVADSREVLELKHGARQCIVTKTRGTITAIPMDGLKPVLARAGQRMEERYDNDLAEGLAWVDVYRNRTYDLAFTRRQLISLRDQWKHVADLVGVSRTVRANLEYDHKRRLHAPRDMDGMLAGDTRPWPDIETFKTYRDDFEQWRKSNRCCCINLDDYRAFQQWQEQRLQLAKAGMTAKGEHPPLVRSFLRAWGAKMYGLPRGTNKELADITSRWWPTTANAVKTARRWGDPFQAVEVGLFEREWIEAVAARWPGINWFRFANPWSWAAADLFGTDPERWEVHMEIPDPVWESITGLPAEVRYDAEGVEGSFAHPPMGANDPLAEEFDLCSAYPEEITEETENCDKGSFALKTGSCHRTRRYNCIVPPNLRNHFKSETGPAARPVVTNLGPDDDSPTVDPVELARLAGVSRLKLDRMRRTAAKRVRRGQAEDVDVALVDLLVEAVPRETIMAAIEVIEAA